MTAMEKTQHWHVIGSNMHFPKVDNVAISRFTLDVLKSKMIITLLILKLLLQMQVLKTVVGILSVDLRAMRDKE